MQKFLVEHKFQIFVIIAVSLLTWYKVFDQTLLGEGYYYFDYNQTFFGFSKSGLEINNIWQYDNFARILFDIISLFLRDRIILYLILQLVIQITLYISLYVTVFYISKNKLISLTSTVFFLASYVGSYEMIATGNYQRFVQRIPNLIPQILVLVFIEKYFEKYKIKYFLFSLFLFAISIFMGHYSTFLSPFIVAFPVVKSFIAKKGKSRLLKGLLLSLSLSIVNLLLISQDPHMPDISLVEFIAQKEDLVLQVFSQLLHVSLPLFITKDIIKISNLTALHSNQITVFLSATIIFVYLVGAIILLKSKSRITALYLSALFSLPAILIFNLYVDKVDAITQIEQSRYYLLPILLISIIQVSIVWVIFKKNTKLSTTIIIVVLLSIYLFFNIRSIWTDINAEQYKSTAMKRYVSYIKSIPGVFSKETVLVTPTSLLWPGSLIEKYYGERGMKFMDFYEGWEKNPLVANRQNVFVIDYDYAENDNYYINKAHIIDLTEKFRRGEKVDYTK